MRNWRYSLSPLKPIPLIYQTVGQLASQVLTPKAIEAQLKKWTEWDQKDVDCTGWNPIIRQTARARIEMFKTAPREKDRLKAALALKKKAWENENEYPAKSILYAELDALERISLLLN